MTFLMVSLPWSSQGDERPLAEVPLYALSVSFDIPGAAISGLAEVPAQAGRELVLSVGQLKIIQASLNNRRIDFDLKAGKLRLSPVEDGVLAITYEGVFKGGETRGDKNYGVVSSTIDSRGIFLTGVWYPQTDALAAYRLKALLPAGYEAVSEAERIEKTVKEGGTEFAFTFDRPVDGISLVATNRYEVTRDRANGIELYAYFFKEDRELAKTYLQYAKKYLEQYEKLLTKYPYARFSIVENFLSTGYSMPTFTLLGQDVVRLPFIVETSLGHEVLHEWFGNSVYIDAEKGNWAEGLTTYLADHLYEEEKGKGWEYRKRMLTDYGAYVNAQNEFPLKDFRGRTDFASRAIGYGKAALVFHMLRKAAGDDKFFAALKEFVNEERFQRASWDDIKAVFEKHTGKDLSTFFKQWIDEKGLLDLRVENAVARRSGNRFEVSFELIRKGKASALELPVTVSFVRGGSSKESVKVGGEKENIKLPVEEDPSKVVIDEDYDLARKLSDSENPAVIARLIGDEKPLIVLPASNREFYQAVIDGFKQRGGEEKEASSLKDSELKQSSLVVLGKDNPVIGREYGSVDVPPAGLSIVIKKNPWNPERVVGLIHAQSAAEVEAAFQKIFHYGKYGSLSFSAGKNVAKKIEDSDRGMQMELRQETVAIDLSLLKTLADVIEGAAKKKIVYVGEYHDRFSHHNVELEVVKALAQKNPKLAVGMEMFQRPFQKTLDDYLSGVIDEREFLKRTEYFKRWSFDYNLYKPILDFARTNKIPVVALNLRREITEKVSKGGMDSLSDEEKKEVPPEMDFSDQEYRDRLKQVFGEHKSREGKNFDFFYQSQILWDETMAQSIDEFLKKNPDYRMVVIAGGGHLSRGSGIPKRAFRRNGYEYAIILSDADVERGAADYIVYPPSLDGVTAPRLMAMLEEKDGKVGITAFSRESPAEQAGLKIGDVLVSLDGAPVKSVEDIKLALFYKKKDDILKVKAVRKRFLLGDKVMEFEVKL